MGQCPDCDDTTEASGSGAVGKRFSHKGLNQIYLQGALLYVGKARTSSDIKPPASDRKKQEPHPDYKKVTINVPNTGMPANELLGLIAQALPGWQATRFPATDPVQRTPHLRARHHHLAVPKGMW